jgi:hypothetical protein
MKMMIARPVDLAHPAGAQRAEDFEAADTVVHRERHDVRRDYKRAAAH